MATVFHRHAEPSLGRTTWWVHVARTLLALLFIVSGVDGFYFLATGANLIHPPMSPAASTLDDALVATGFMWPLIKAFNLVGGTSLLLNAKPALGLAIILPAITVITLYHFVLNAAGIPAAVVMDALAATLLYAYRARFAGLLR